MKLTDGQQALVDATDSLFAAACPGAGKTRAMVARFLKRTAEEPRRGIALISFTNAAVDEVRHRCGSQTEGCWPRWRRRTAGLSPSTRGRPSPSACSGS
ncbi:UvrD-helicase domain-containing protein [Streptomyces mirabilis]|uniref:UvrD-helicase domain-containing protein n=1 Tax=Streptomyces mirabilis TaxID=68239 RepID=UPI0036BDFEFA